MKNKLIKTFVSLLTIFIMFFIGSNKVNAEYDKCVYYTNSAVKVDNINIDALAAVKTGKMTEDGDIIGRGQKIGLEYLKNKKVGSAGLDVYEEEGEYFYEDKSDRIIDDDVLARLLSFNNVIVTSHQAFFTKEALGNIATTTLQNIRDFINHKPLLNEVKK